MSDSIIGRRKRGNELMKTAEAMYGKSSYTTGGTGEANEWGTLVKDLNSEAGKVGDSDAEFADRLRRMALKVANASKRRR